MKNINKKKIGILGGSFDPPHKGHLKITEEAIKKYKLKKVYWSITKKNPFKQKNYLTLKMKMSLSKKISKKNKKIKVIFIENKIYSNKTIDLIKFFKKKYKSTELYFIMGADNLISFHKWQNWKDIIKLSKVLVFDRYKFKAKSKKSITFKKFHKKGVEFVNFKKVNISSSQLRKFW